MVSLGTYHFTPFRRVIHSFIFSKLGNCCINKKNVENLLNPSDDQAERNDHIVFDLTPAVDGVSAANPTVTYDGREYTPEISLVNYVYDYDDKEYKETTLVPNVDYTATIVPGTNAGDYYVTITAVAESEKYIGSGTFKWNIETREFTPLTVEDAREDAEYDGEAVADAEFTVSGFGTTNPGITSADDCELTHRYYALKNDVQNPSLATLTRNDFEKDALDSNPVNAGFYWVEIDVIDEGVPGTDATIHNYKKATVGAAFEIEKKAAIIVPDETNNITYGQFVNVNGLTFTLDRESIVTGDEVSTDGLGLKVVASEATGVKTYVEATDALDAGTYAYELTTTECTNTNY